MKNKNTVKDLVIAMEENGENPNFIIGWLQSMIQCSIDLQSDLQGDVDTGLKYYSLKKVRNSARSEELYA